MKPNRCLDWTLALISLIVLPTLLSDAQAYKSSDLSNLVRSVPTALPELPEPESIFEFLPPAQYASLVYFYCSEQHLLVDIACRVAWNESRWKPSAFSWHPKPRKAQTSKRPMKAQGWDGGIFQLSNDCLEDFRVYNEGKTINVFDPAVNIKVGIRHLAACLRSSGGNLRRALVIWNAGLTGQLDEPTSTKKFVVRLLRY